MNKVKVRLWNRVFDIPVSYSWYPGQQVTQQQEETLQAFCAKEYPADCALSELKKYVIKTSDGEVKEPVDNIFKYVIPKSLYIPRSEESIIAIICNYKFDMENGIAVVLKNGRLEKIGTQDIIL